MALKVESRPTFLLTEGGVSLSHRPYGHKGSSSMTRWLKEVKPLKNYTVILNHIIRDVEAGKLSDEAAFVYVHLMSLPDDWIIRKDEIRMHHPGCGREKFNRIWQELLDAGYLTLEIKRKGETWQYLYTVQPLPVPESERTYSRVPKSTKASKPERPAESEQLPEQAAADTVILIKQAKPKKASKLGTDTTQPELLFDAPAESEVPGSGFPVPRKGAGSSKVEDLSDFGGTGFRVPGNPSGTKYKNLTKYPGPENVILNCSSSSAANKVLGTPGAPGDQGLEALEVSQGPGAKAPWGPGVQDAPGDRHETIVHANSTTTTVKKIKEMSRQLNFPIANNLAASLAKRTPKDFWNDPQNSYLAFILEKFSGTEYQKKPEEERIKCIRSGLWGRGWDDLPGQYVAWREQEKAAKDREQHRRQAKQQREQLRQDRLKAKPTRCECGGILDEHLRCQCGAEYRFNDETLEWGHSPTQNFLVAFQKNLAQFHQKQQTLHEQRPEAPQEPNQIEEENRKLAIRERFERLIAERRHQQQGV